MDDKKKKLRKMAIWTLAIFATVFAVFMALFWLMLYPLMPGGPLSVLGAALSQGWPIFLIAAVICIVIYYAYKLYLDRKN